MLVCACGGAIIAMARGAGKPHVYGCSWNCKKGAAACGNNLRLARERLDAAVLACLAQAFSTSMLDEAVERALTALRERRDRGTSRRPALERELAAVEVGVRRLTDAVAKGKGTDVLLEKLEAEAAKQRDLQHRLAELDGATKAVTLDAARLTGALRAAVADVAKLLGQSTPAARQALRKVLVEGRLRCEPLTDGRRGYRFSGRGSFGKLIAGCVTTDANPGGYGGPFRGPPSQ